MALNEGQPVVLGAVRCEPRSLEQLHLWGVRWEHLELCVAGPAGQLGLPHNTAFSLFARAFSLGALVIIITTQEIQLPEAAMSLRGHMSVCWLTVFAELNFKSCLRQHQIC